MKKVIIILLLGFMMSCIDEIPLKNSIEGSYLTVDVLKEYIPKEYIQESNLVYKDEQGVEKILEIAYTPFKRSREINGMEYTADDFNAQLFNLEDRLTIVVSGSTNYSHSETVVMGLHGYLMPFNEGGHTWLHIGFENDEPIVEFGDDFRASATFHGKEFKNVYVQIGKDNLQVPHKGYSELVMNKEVGIVAFRDEYNELWVFDRFEN